MNSLNESAALEMDPSSVREAASSPEDGNSKEAIGAISRAYRDIFTTGSQEGAAKRANITATTNNNTSPFSQEANFPQTSTHTTSTQSYQSCPVAPAGLCPVAPNDNQHTFHNVDNNRYTYLLSANQNHDQSNSATRQRGSSANHGFHNAGSAPSQSSCPWKLASGAKVLVSTEGIQNYINTPTVYLVQQTIYVYFCVFCLSLRPVLLMRGLYQEQSARVRRYGNPFPSVSLLLSKRW